MTNEELKHKILTMQEINKGISRLQLISLLCVFFPEKFITMRMAKDCLQNTGLVGDTVGEMQANECKFRQRDAVSKVLKLCDDLRLRSNY